MLGKLNVLWARRLLRNKFLNEISFIIFWGCLHLQKKTINRGEIRLILNSLTTQFVFLFEVTNLSSHSRRDLRSEFHLYAHVGVNVMSLQWLYPVNFDDSRAQNDLQIFGWNCNFFRFPYDLAKRWRCFGKSLLRRSIQFIFYKMGSVSQPVLISGVITQGTQNSNAIYRG